MAIYPRRYAFSYLSTSARSQIFTLLTVSPRGKLLLLEIRHRLLAVLIAALIQLSIVTRVRVERCSHLNVAMLRNSSTRCWRRVPRRGRSALFRQHNQV